MMRLLLVSQTYHPYLFGGGRPAKVGAIGRALAARGHEVLIATAKLGDQDWGAELGPYEPHRATRQRFRDMDTTWFPALVQYHHVTLPRGVRRYCRDVLPTVDAVHIFGLYDVLGLQVAAECRRLGVPYVVEPMGMMKPVERSILKKRFYHAFPGRALIRGAARVVVNSPRELAEAREEGIPTEKLTLRRNGLELSEFAHLPPRGAFRAAIGIGPDTPLLLCLGRISRKKGLPMLIQALSALPPRTHLAIVGPDDGDGTIEEVARLARRPDVAGRVHLCPPRYGTDRLEAYVDADVFVLASQSENFGNVVAEAAACGTPMVVTDRCGVAPLVEDRAGIVVPYEEKALAAGIVEALHPAVHARLKAGTLAVANALTWDGPIAEQEQIYANAAARGRPAGRT